VLGVLGVGGIGQILNDSLEFREYGLTGMALIVVVVTTMVIDTVSGAVRRRIIAGPSGGDVRPADEPATVAEVLV
jgi:phosphonate transport system permease protein